MFLRKIALSGIFALIIGFFGITSSFDAENYASYADNPVVAIERFAAEPVFPLFVLALGGFELPPLVVVQLFMTLASFVIVFAVGALANNGTKYSLLRTIFAVMIASPFIMFSVIVPRQALAVGLILSAVARLQMKRGVFDWGTIALLCFSVLTHGATSIWGGAMIFLGYLRLHLLFLLFFVAPVIALLLLVGLFPELFGVNYIAYFNYFGEFRETGVFRLWMFVVVALVYLSLSSWRSAGFFARSVVRNIVVVLIFASCIVFLYFAVTTDAVRLVYPIGIIMLSEIVNRVSFFGRASLVGWDFLLNYR